MHLTTKLLASAVPTKRGYNRFHTLQKFARPPQMIEKIKRVSFVNAVVTRKTILIEVKMHNYEENERRN